MVHTLSGSVEICGSLHLDGRIMLAKDVLEDAVLVLEASVHPGGHQARGRCSPCTSVSVTPHQTFACALLHVAKRLAALRPCGPAWALGQQAALELSSPQPRSAAAGAQEQRFCGTAHWRDERKLDLQTVLSPPCLQRPSSGTPAAWDTPWGGTRSKQHMKRAAPRKNRQAESPTYRRLEKPWDIEGFPGLPRGSALRDEASISPDFSN